MWFLFRILIAVFGYAIQSVLLTKYSRKYDWQRVWFLRNSSLILTWLPLLYFWDLPEIGYFYEHRPLIVLWAVCGATNIFLSFVSTTLIPVGIWATIRKWVSLVVSFLLWILFLHESITFYQALSVFFIVLGGFGISFSKMDVTHLGEQDVKKWVFLSLWSGAIQSVWRYFFMIYAAWIDPLISAYILESSIWVCMLVRWVVQFSRGVYTFNDLRQKDTIMIALISILSYVGTIAYATALGLGGLWLSSGMMVMMIPVSIIIAWFLFRERLTWKQLVWIGVVLVGVVIYQLWG